MNGPNLIHDIGITKDNIIILDLPLQFSLTNIIFSEFPIDINKGERSRIGIMNRKTYNVEWYYLKENEIIFHIANSWEEKKGKVIIIYVICYNIEKFDITKLEKQRPILKRIKINRETKKIKIKKVSNNTGELPIIEDNKVGKRCEYIYYSNISEKGFDGIIRHEIKTQEEQIYKFPEGMYGGESAIYDKYIINILYDEKNKRSKLIIYNKDTFELLNLIDLRCRIPFGFHGKIINLN
jgi:carotenoid cleavage dioxygenase